MNGETQPFEHSTTSETERLTFALEAAGVGTWDLDPIHQRVRWDARCKALYGFSEDDVVPYERVLHYMHPDDQARVHQAVQSALDSQFGGNYDVEFRTVGAEDGQTRWLHCKGRAYFNEQGVAYRFSGIAQDVTKDVGTARQIAETETRFRSLIEEAPVATCLFVGRDLVVEIANQTMQAIWGKGDAVLGKPLVEALPELQGQPFLQILDEVYTTGQVYQAVAAPCDLVVDGVLGRYYFDFTYKPLRNAAGDVYAIMNMAVDVTERVTAQRKIQESEAYFRQLTDVAPVIIWTTRPDGYCTYLNKQWYEYTGQTLAEAEGYGWLNATHPDDQAEAGRKFIAANQQHVPFDLVYRLRDKDGQYRWALDKGSPRFGPNGEYEGMIGTVVDVHEQLLSRQQLETSETKLRSLVDAAPFPIGVYESREMRIQLANQSIIETWGKGPDVVGKTYAEVLPELATQDIFAQLDDVYTTGVPFEAKNQRVDLAVDGTLQPYYFNYTFTPLHDAGGRVYGVMNTAANVTDLALAKQQVESAEASLRGAIDLAKLATWSMDIPTGTFHYSARFMDWLGFSEETKLIDEAYNPVPDEDRPSVADAIAEAVRPGSLGYYENEHPIINQLTGQVRIIHAQAQVFYDAAGQPAVLSGTAQDVTEQRKTQLALEQQVQERTEELAATNEELAATNEELAATNEELTESNQLLIRSNENLQRFAYVASHDLQEPLRKVQQFGDLLKTQYAAELGEGTTYLERMQAAAARMSALIRDLLSFSRISTQRDTYESVALGDVVQSVLTDLELSIQETGAVVTVGELPTVEGDASQLGQLFQNLLSNALKFRKPDITPQIRVTAQVVDAPDLPPSVKPTRTAKMYHRINVTDNGIGFDDKYIDRIFQVFQRLHGRNQYAGTGVGLAISEKVATNHGGAISAISQPGQGATFSVYLPV